MLHGLVSVFESVSVDFSALYLVLKVLEKGCISSPLTSTYYCVEVAIVYV